jgi:hypothetical protein
MEIKKIIQNYKNFRKLKFVELFANMNTKCSPDPVCIASHCHKLATGLKKNTYGSFTIDML